MLELDFMASLEETKWWRNCENFYGEALINYLGFGLGKINKREGKEKTTSIWEEEKHCWRQKGICLIADDVCFAFW